METTTIKTIGQLSPSQVQIFKECALRIIFQKNIPSTFFFASSPASVLGNVVHKILELANKRKVDLSNFEAGWEFAFVQAQKDFFKNAYNARFRNLKYWLPFYAVKKQIIRSRVAQLPPLGAIPFKGEHEFQFTNKDIEIESTMECGLLTGKPDVVNYENGFAYVTDYKTGAIVTYKNGKEVGIKSEYVEQLKTYGVIIGRNQGIEASHIILFLENTSSGETKKITFTGEEYEAHYKDLHDRLLFVNQQITAGTHQSLGNAGGRACASCQFRPVCINYSQLLRINSSCGNDIYIIVKKLAVTNGRHDLETVDGTIIMNIPIEDINRVNFQVDYAYFIYNLYSAIQHQGMYYWTRYSAAYSVQEMSLT